MSIKQDNILTSVLEKKISRRSFVKWSAALGATASMSGLVMQTGAKMATGAEYVPATAGPTALNWKPTCCLVCHSWCHIACGVDAAGHVRKIEGAGGQPKTYSTGSPIATWPVGAPVQTKADDANHIATPAGFLAYAPHNKGRICAKGNDGVEHLYDPDRIKYPLRATAGRGAGQWEMLDWDTALTEIANVLRELAGLTTKTDGSPIVGARGKDLRHRFVQFVGRNENGAPKNFSKAYGTPNHIEHTSLCELGRHVAGRTMWGHHWSSVDLQVHTDGNSIDFPAPGDGGPGGALTLDSNLHDTDCYIEWGGNPCEAKIPHSTWANHFGDRRRRNLQGFSGGPRAGTTYGRIMCIDVRQSNTSAFADEYFNIVPGTDGALALALIYYVLDGVGQADTVRRELERGHNGGTGGLCDLDAGYDASTRLYYGMFAAEEGGGVASGSAATAVPAGKSLETYLFGGEFEAAVGATGPTWAEIRDAVAGLTGLDGIDDIEYLGSLFKTGAGGAFLNVVTDTYRGPVKHTNGVYNTRAIRALQYLAPNYSASQYWTTSATTSATPRGGYNAPGAFCSDKNWNPYANGGGVPGSGGLPGYINSVLDAGAANDAVGANGVPADQGMKLAGDNTSNRQRIDDWDYDYDVPRYRGAYKWVDQNLSPGIRHSVGMNAFVIGSPKNAAVKGPYYYQDWRNPGGPTFDAPGDLDADGYKVEAMLIHKNAPGYARPQQNNEVDLLVAKNPDGTYKLKHFWSIDIAMGDGTRFADIILPDVTYLERYAERSGEGQEFNYRPNIFWRVPVYEQSVNVDFGGSTGFKAVPRHMYESRQVRGIFYELARKIEPGDWEKALAAPAAAGQTVFTVSSNDGVSVGKGVYYRDKDGSGNWHQSKLGTVVSVVPNGPDFDVTVSVAATSHAGHTSPKLLFGEAGIGAAAATRWSGGLYHTFKWVSGDAGSVAGNAAAGNAHYNDGEYANKAVFEQGQAGLDATGVSAGAADGADWVRSHGMIWNTNDDPGYWRSNSFKGDGETGGAGDSYAPGAGFKPNLTTSVGNMFTVYNKRLDTTPDMIDSAGNVIITHATETNAGYFDGRPVWIKPIQLETWSPASAYPLHLTTYKVNVHTQSRTANLPRLAEILGNSWAVIHPDTANGTNPANAALAADPIVNGNSITVSSETGDITAVAKVSEKAQPGCVHISHSFGHRKGVMSVESNEGNPDRAAYGEYKVTEDGMTYKKNRELSTTVNNPAGSPADDWVLALPPTAPGKGTHCNIVITHHLNGDAGTGYTGRNIATDAIGGDQAWFDTKVKIVKI